MTPDDTRHGTSAGYIAGCRESCCWRAKQRYDKRRRSELLSTGKYRKVPSVGAIRRIQALQALGWSIPEVSKRIGIHHQHLYNLHRYPTVYTATHEKIAAAYESMCMTRPPQETTGQRISVVRASRNADRKGYAPPLAWDNIDDPDEIPVGRGYVPPTRAELLAEYAERGDNLTAVTRALDLSRNSLQVWCANNGMREIYRLLSSREGFGNQHGREVA